MGAAAATQMAPTQLVTMIVTRGGSPNVVAIIVSYMKAAPQFACQCLCGGMCSVCGNASRSRCSKPGPHTLVKSPKFEMLSRSCMCPTANPLDVNIRGLEQCPYERCYGEVGRPPVHCWLCINERREFAGRAPLPKYAMLAVIRGASHKKTHYSDSMRGAADREYRKMYLAYLTETGQPHPTGLNLRRVRFQRAESRFVPHEDSCRCGRCPDP